MKTYRGEVSGTSEYFGYNEGPKIHQKIRGWARAHPREEPLILIGHSWGGATVLELANTLEKEGIVPDVLVTLDAVARWASSTKNKKLWINVHRGRRLQDVIAEVPIVGQLLGGLISIIRGESVSNTIATIGGVLGEESGADKNIRLPDVDHADADRMMAEVVKQYSRELYPNRPIQTPKKSANTGVFEFDYEEAILKVKAQCEQYKRYPGGRR